MRRFPPKVKLLPKVPPRRRRGSTSETRGRGGSLAPKAWFPEREKKESFPQNIQRHRSSPKPPLHPGLPSVRLKPGVTLRDLEVLCCWPQRVRIIEDGIIMVIVGERSEIFQNNIDIFYQWVINGLCTNTKINIEWISDWKYCFRNAFLNCHAGCPILLFYSYSLREFELETGYF